MGGSEGLSIAIPTYDRRESVVSLVEAIKCQLLPKDDELIVVDDRRAVIEALEFAGYFGRP